MLYGMPWASFGCCLLETKTIASHPVTLTDNSCGAHILARQEAMNQI